jgi:amino acid transporter
MIKPETKRELGLFYAVIIALNGAIGIEIFVLLNYAIYLAGTAVVLSLFLCGIINLLTMLSFCELGAAIPEVGSDYTYAKVAFGGIIAFLVGWLRWLSSTFGATLAAIGFAYMVSYFIPVSIPLTAVAIIIVFTLISVRGIKEADAITVLIALAALSAFVLLGLKHGFKLGAFQTLTPHTLPGIFAATAYAFPMFIGGRALVAAASRIKEPSKNVPRAIVFSAVVTMILYCSMAYVTVGVTSPEALSDPSTPFLTNAAMEIMGDAGSALLVIAGMFAAICSLTTSMMVQSGVTQGLSRDGYFPKILLTRHKRFGTPYVAIIMNSAFLMLFAATGVIEFIGYITGFAALLGFALVNITLIRLRKEKPFLDRPFKTPLYPFVPILGIIMSLTLLVFIELRASALMFEFIVLALIIYYLRMTGYHRLRVALGGINLGIAGFMALLLYLTGMDIMPLAVPPPVLCTSILILSVYALAGILNLIAKVK